MDRCVHTYLYNKLPLNSSLALYEATQLQISY